VVGGTSSSRRPPVTHPFAKYAKRNGAPTALLVVVPEVICFLFALWHTAVRRAAELRLAGRPRRPSLREHSRSAAGKIYFRTGFPAGSSYVHRRK